MSKPAGMPPLPSRAGVPGPPAGATLLAWVRRAGAGRDAHHLRLVYAPEGEASGLALFARTEQAAEALQAEFAGRRVDRLGLALVLGQMGREGEASAQTGGTVQTLLRRDRYGRWHSIRADEFSGPRATPGARDDRSRAASPACTHYRLVRSGNGLSLVRLRLETDRPHQARVHLAELGHPIVEDRLYGRPEPDRRRSLDRLGLHITELSFTHPGTRQTVRYVSPAPPEFRLAVGDRAETAPGASGDSGATAWEEVAEWYDELIAERGSDHYEQVILPGTLALLDPVAGERVLDIACGQGVFSRLLNERGVETVGVDASQRLIEAGSARSGPLARYFLADVRSLPSIQDELGGAGSFDGAACVMALMNIDPVEPVVQGCGALLKPGARLVIVILHPAFRSPGRTSWGWERTPDGEHRQFRRVDAYLSTDRREVVMNPGAAAAGGPPVTTPTFVRPIGWYAAHLAKAGFVIDAIEEWASRRVSQPGPRADAENRARGEIPQFLAIRARRLPVTPPSAGEALTDATIR